MQAAGAVIALAASGNAFAGTFEQTANGIVVKPDTGAAKEVRLELMDDNIIHVLKLDASGKALTPSLMNLQFTNSWSINDGLPLCSWTT